MAAAKKKPTAPKQETPRVKALTYLFTLLSITFAALAFTFYA